MIDLFKNFTLKRSLILLLLTSFILSAISFFAIYYKLSERSMESLVTNNLGNVTKIKAEFADYWLKHHLDLIEGIAGSKLALTEDPETIKNIIENYSLNTDFYEVAFIDSEGKVLYDSRGFDSLDISDREYFKQLKSKKSVISDVLTLKSNSDKAIVFASSIYKNKKFTGAVVGAVLHSEVTRLIDSASYEGINKTYIINNSGNLISYTDHSAKYDSNRLIVETFGFEMNSYKKHYQEVLKNGYYIDNYLDKAGKSMLISCSLIPSNNWILVNEVNVPQSIYAIRTDSANAGIIALIMISILFIPMMVYISNRLTTPINNIANLANELSLGNFDKRIKYNSKNEIGILAHAFNTMAQNLQNTYKELHDNITDLNIQKQEINIKNLKLEQAIEVNRTILDQLEEKNKQLEQANRLKAEFLANMSHEFRTPMNSIIGYTEMILDEDDGDINDEQKKDLNIILKSAENLLALINDVLDLSKIEAGKVTYNFKKFNIVDEISQLVENIRIMAESKDLDLTLEYQENLPEIYSDSIKISQIVSNMLSNAVKFTDQGEIKVLITIENENMINISVKDTGIGIAEKDLASIFDEFRQVDGSYTRKYGGTGLGLTIAKGLAEGLGGKISVSSKLGQGSTFTLTVPVSKSSPIVIENKSLEKVEISESASSEKKLIIVVTRNSNNYSSIEGILSKHNYKVITTDYLKSLDTIKALNPYCIFIDIDLPCTNCNDGWLTLVDIKQDRTVSNIPIVIVSTQTSTSLSFILGASDYLIKPFREDDLLNSLNRCLKKQGRGYVLLVEEDKETADLVSTIIRKNTPFNTLTVNSKKDITSVLNSSPSPSLIIMDTSLMSLRPIEIMNLINSVDVKRQIPILVLSSRKMGSVELEYIKQNASVILDKSDIRYSKLVVEIKKLLFEIK